MCVCVLSIGDLKTKNISLSLSILVRMQPLNHSCFMLLHSLTGLLTQLLVSIRGITCSFIDKPQRSVINPSSYAT